MAKISNQQGQFIKINQCHRTCAFCANEAGNKEHVFPDWLLKKFPQAGFDHSVSLGRRHPETGYVHRPNAAALTLKIVCDTCNNGWMSQLQTRAKPILESIIDSGLRPLSAQDAKILASWVAMTTFVVEFADLNTRQSSDEERHSLKTNNELPKNWNIAICRYEGKPILSFNHVGFDLYQSPKNVITCSDGFPLNPVFESHSTSLLFGKIGFISCGSREGGYSSSWEEICQKAGMVSIYPFNQLKTQYARAVNEIEFDTQHRITLPIALALSIRPFWETLQENRSGRRRPIN